MFTVYILYSPDHDRYYIGQTNNIDERLKRHSKGLVKSTKAYLPIKVVYTEEFDTRSEAMRREVYLKSLKSKKKIIQLVNTS